MWFIFPQIVGLGYRAVARRFAIGSKREAQAFLAHDLPGPRLMECTRLVMAAASEKRISEILGFPDDMKFRSSMTLFDAVSNQELFAEAIATFYSDGRDPATLEILSRLAGQAPNYDDG